MNIEELTTRELEAKLAEAERFTEDLGGLASRLRAALELRRATLNGPAGAVKMRDRRRPTETRSASNGSTAHVPDTDALTDC